MLSCCVNHCGSKYFVIFVLGIITNLYRFTMKKAIILASRKRSSKPYSRSSASANSQKQTGTDIRSEDAGPAALSSGQGIGLMRPRHSACENAPHVHRLFRKRGYRGGIRIRVRRDYRRGFGRRRAISVSAA